MSRPKVCLLQHARLYFCVLAVLLLPSLSAAAQTTAVRPDIALVPPGDQFKFVIYGDPRFTSPLDHKHSDPAIREALVERIAQEQPQFVAVAGDIVFHGDDKNDWNVFDQETRLWRNSGIKVIPVLGNHDVHGSETVALANYFQRFPSLGERRWYSVQDGKVRLFVLDSNSPDGRGSRQFQWLDQSLSSLPTEVEFVILTLHHPPYTESAEHLMGGGHTARTPEKELAQMVEQHQAKMAARIVMVCGHVHNYERYEHGGVMYLVSGGGGATPYMIHRHGDGYYNGLGATYHFCDFTVNHGSLKMQMIKYMGPAQWAVKDSFELASSQLQSQAGLATDSSSSFRVQR